MLHEWFTGEKNLTYTHEYLHHFVAACNIRAARDELALAILCCIELINSVNRFSLLLVVCGTSCRRMCLVVAP